MATKDLPVIEGYADQFGDFAALDLTHRFAAIDHQVRCDTDGYPRAWVRFHLGPKAAHGAYDMAWYAQCR